MTTIHRYGVPLLSLGLLSAALAGCNKDESAGTPPAPPTAPAPAPAPASSATPSEATTAPSPTDPVPPPAPGPAAEAAAPTPAGTQQDAAAGKRVSVQGVSFELPEGWSQGPARQMRLATLTDGTGEIVVSMFPADPSGNPAGGLLANVNRFRAQVQLPEVASDAEAQRLFTEVDAAGRKARVLDLKGEQSRNVVAMVPADGRFYYFRMTGANDVVGARKDAFDRLLQTVRVE
jgi:hypothetical protein